MPQPQRASLLTVPTCLIVASLMLYVILDVLIVGFGKRIVTCQFALQQPCFHGSLLHYLT